MDSQANASGSQDLPLTLYDPSRRQKGKARAAGSGTKRQWTKEEDAILADCLLVLKEKGAFKVGFLMELQKMMEERLPSSGLKASPHIESRYKLWKRQYGAISDMLNHGSGFGWNDVDKCVTASPDVFDEWVKSHPTAKGLRNKPFPHYDTLSIVFGKDRAVGAGAETPADAVEDLDSQIPENYDQAMDVDDDFDVGSNVPEKDPVDGSRATRTHTTSSSKKRNRGEDGTSEIVDQLKKWRDSYEFASQGIEKIASFLDNSKDKTNILYAAIEELGLFSPMQAVDVFEAMCKDKHKIEVFMGLPESLRGPYVMRILDESSHMAPTCVFCRSLGNRGKSTSGRASVFEQRGKKAKVSGQSI